MRQPGKPLSLNSCRAPNCRQPWRSTVRASTWPAPLALPWAVSWSLPPAPRRSFFLNAASFLGVLVVLYRWQRPRSASLLPPEHVFGAIRAGVRYVRHAPVLPAVLLRVGSFIVCGAALWALLPLVAQQGLDLGAIGYGGLLGCLGLGAVAGAILLPRARQHVAIDPLVAGATALFAATMLILAYGHSVVLVSAAMLAGGMAWMVLTSAFMVAVQTAVPARVRARALAVYMLVFQDGMAAGS